MIIVILLAILVVGIVDYIHNKDLLKTPGAWIKYVVGLGCGLAFGLIQKLPFFDYLVLAGVVVLGCNFWTLISNAVVSLYNKLFKKSTTTTVGKV